MKKTNTGNIRRGFLFASLGSIGWGISGVCSQYLFTKYDLRAAWLTAVRMLLSGLVLLLLVFRKEKMRTFAIWKNRKDVGQLLAFALLGLLMCQYTFLGAIKYSNSATATVLQSLNVIFMAVIVAIQSRTRIGIQQTLAILLSLVGTFLIATKGNPTRMQLSAAGLVLGLLAAAGVVIYTLLSRPIISDWGNLSVTGWGMLIGGLVLFLGTRAWILPANLDSAAWLMITVIVLIGTAVGFSAFLEGVRYIGPVKATLIGCLEPVSATVLSALFLGTRFSMAELLGFGLILLTVFLSVLERKG